jgi:hypothetical protein
MLVSLKEKEKKKHCSRNIKNDAKCMGTGSAKLANKINHHRG